MAMDKTARNVVETIGILRSEKGQTAIEYALVAVFIALVLVFAFRDAHVESGISTAASKVQCALESPP
jgi:Flp pilus assembly pilin Flp